MVPDVRYDHKLVLDTVNEASLHNTDWTKHGCVTKVLTAVLKKKSTWCHHFGYLTRDLCFYNILPFQPYAFGSSSTWQKSHQYMMHALTAPPSITIINQQPRALSCLSCSWTVCSGDWTPPVQLVSNTTDIALTNSLRRNYFRKLQAC